MQKTLKAALIAAALSGVALTGANVASAEVSFSFNIGDVAVGYDDGYWDHNRRWHAWSHPSHRDEYRRTHGDRYHAGYHTRYRDNGWIVATPGVTFDFGNVAVGYVDGYWDHNRVWHTWQYPYHRDEFRRRHADRYHAGYHSRYRDNGWIVSTPVVTFNFGDVVVGYEDGYWDRNHRWHAWQDTRHRDMYRSQRATHYFAGPHHRYPNQGWR